MSRRTERRAHITPPQEKPLHAFFMPHGVDDAHLLQAPHEQVDRMLTDNPGKRVTIHSESVNGVDKISRAVTEGVLRGKDPKTVWIDVGYKYFVKSHGLNHSPSEERVTKARFAEQLESNAFVRENFKHLDKITKKHPGRVLWIPEGSDPKTTEDFYNINHSDKGANAPLFRSTGSNSYAEFVEQKVGELREVGILHRRRDDKVKEDVRETLKRKDVVGGVLWRGIAHQHIADELLEEGYSVSVTSDGAGESQRIFFAPDMQLFREMMADPTREVPDEELDIAIKATLWYDGPNQEMLGNVANWAENRKREAGIQTLGQRELIIIRNGGLVDTVGSDYVPQEVVESQNPDTLDAQRNALRPPNLRENVTYVPPTGIDEARSLIAHLHPDMDPEKRDMIAATLQSVTDDISYRIVSDTQEDPSFVPFVEIGKAFPNLSSKVRTPLAEMFDRSIEAAETAANNDAAPVISIYSRRDTGKSSNPEEEVNTSGEVSDEPQIGATESKSIAELEADTAKTDKLAKKDGKTK